MQLILWALSSFLPAFMATRASFRFVISEAASLWSLSISIGGGSGASSCFILQLRCFYSVQDDLLTGSSSGSPPPPGYISQFSGMPPESMHALMSGSFDLLYQQSLHSFLRLHLFFIRVSIVSSCSLSDGGSFDISRSIMSASGS